MMCHMRLQILPFEVFVVLTGILHLCLSVIHFPVLFLPNWQDQNGGYGGGPGQASTFHFSYLTCHN